MLRPIPGFPGYLASDDGYVFSAKPWGGNNGRGAKPPSSPRRLAVMIYDGYRYVHLINDGKRIMKKVSWCVLNAFVGPRSSGMEICHGPKGKGEDDLANLSWKTKLDNNTIDKERDGVLFRGERHPRAKLSLEDVRYIRRMKGVETGVSLARRFNVAATTISAVQHGQNWQSNLEDRSAE